MHRVSTMLFWSAVWALACACSTVPPKSADNEGDRPGYGNEDAGEAEAGDLDPDDDDDQVHESYPDASTRAPNPKCAPGHYEGSYNCSMLGAFGEGPLAFDLVLKDGATEAEGTCVGLEFCADLVISDASAELKGMYGPLVFTAHLSGGLDCSSGQFKAEVTDGEVGEPSPWPGPKNTITGMVTGMHMAGPPQAITGKMVLVPSVGITCPSDFTVTLEP
ncbi:MAG: hypothetical protein QM778_38770 [Myxococcales bacterium]